MLEYIRNSAQSWGVKIAFGIIILVFVFWGIGNYNDRDYSNIVAVVNGEPIVALEFERAYHNAEEALLRQNPGLTREQLAKDHLGSLVLNDLIRQTALIQEAQKHGIEISPLELRYAIGQMEPFQNEKGQFDPEVYQRVLAARRMTPGQYERELANQLLQTRLMELVGAGVWIDPEEARNRFNFLKERRIVDWLFVPAERYLEQAQVTAEEVSAWYEEHRNDYAIPQMADIAFIRIHPADLVQKEEIGPEALQNWYEANKAKFTTKEQVHARHILVPLAQDADETARKAAEEQIERIAAELQAGKEFAAVADQYNQPGAAGPGGDLGWLARGETVPEFEEAAFSLPVGKVSERVTTQFGLHLVLVEEKKDAGAKPLAEVANEGYRALATEEGLEKLPEALDNLIEDNILQKPLADSAKRYNLKAEETGLLDKAGLMEKLGVNAAGAEALLSVAEGIPLDTALEAGDSYIMGRVIKSTPPSTKPLQEVQEAIEQQLKARKALDLALQEGRNILEKVKGEDLAQAKGQYPDIRQDDRLERVGMIPGFRANDRLVEAIFEGKTQSWLTEPFSVTADTGQAGAMVVYVGPAVKPRQEEFEPVAELFGQAARQERIEGMYELFLDNLMKNTKAELTNRTLVDRID